MANRTPGPDGKPLKGDRCQCQACGAWFNSTYAFDKHRSGDWEARSCRSPEQMATHGMVRNARGFWVSSTNAWRHDRG